jgi:hypothetical protein
MALYQKVSQEVNAGADRQTLQGDSARLAIAARANGDIGLERDARNLGNSLGDGSYGKDGTMKELAANAPGTIGARQMPEICGSNGSALGLAFSQLEKDVAGNTSFVGADADLLQGLAKQNGECDLADVANKIKESLKDGSYSQFDSLEALMQHPAKSSDMVGSPPSTGTASTGTASTGAASTGTGDASGLSALVGPDKARMISDIFGTDKAKSVAGLLKAISHQ